MKEKKTKAGQKNLWLLSRRKEKVFIAFKTIELVAIWKKLVESLKDKVRETTK